MYAWVIKDKWLADQLEIDAFAFDDDEPEPFDAKKAAAGDMEKDDEPIPF